MEVKTWPLTVPRKERLLYPSCFGMKSSAPLPLYHKTRHYPITENVGPCSSLASNRLNNTHGSHLMQSLAVFWQSWGSNLDRKEVGNWTVGEANVMLFMFTKHPGDSREPGLSGTVKRFPLKDGSSQREILFFLQGLTFCVCFHLSELWKCPSKTEIALVSPFVCLMLLIP